MDSLLKCLKTDREGEISNFSTYIASIKYLQYKIIPAFKLPMNFNINYYLIKKL